MSEIPPQARAGRIEDYDYELPPELVAQEPPPERGRSRLLVAHRKSGQIEDRAFSDLPSYLKPGEALVLNDTKVFPARLLGRKETGGKVEVLLIGPSAEDPLAWRVLLQPALKEGQEFWLPPKTKAIYAGRDLDGMALVKLEVDDVAEYARKHGQMPLPPYIKREPSAADVQSYQTVYAQREGAVAAPTAGLHFTPALIEALRAQGVETHTVTLHVGYGTFKPVKDLETHRMHTEHFELKPETADALNRAHRERRKVWAVGTTSVRVLETCALKGQLIPGEGETDLFLSPPAKFEFVDGLLTNFHLPRSTLLLLVAAFMGTDFMKRAYKHAIENKYRFYSYGDAMLIV